MIYLASTSPRRHELLQQIGIAHQVLVVPSPPGEDEPIIPGETAEHYVCRTAKDKVVRATDWVAEKKLEAWPILSADTTVMLGGHILGKPGNDAAAKTMLARLSGRSHQVYTAVVLAHRLQYYEALSITEVRFKSLTEKEIASYCAGGEPFGKAGAYAIQGAASVFIEHISGSFSGVMGLPLFETHQLLLQAELL